MRKNYETFDEWILGHRSQAPSPLAPFFTSGLQEFRRDIEEMEAKGLIEKHSFGCRSAECAWLHPRDSEQEHFVFTEKGRELYAPKVMAAALRGEA